MTTAAAIVVAVADERPALVPGPHEEHRGDDGDRGDRDGEDAREDALVVHVARDDERPDEEAGADDRRRPVRGATRRVGARSRRSPSVRSVRKTAPWRAKRRHDRDPGEDRVAR